MTTSNPLLTVPDYEARARETVPEAVFNRMFGTYGAPDWVTNTNNVLAFHETRLRPRVLVDVSQRNLSTEVLGQKISFPVMLAAAGSHQRVHPQGELASARAAGAAGTILALSTVSSFSIEEVAEVATEPLWFQLYFFQDRELTETLVRRAEMAGYTALLLTVDNLGAPTTERDFRYAYTLNAERVLKNLATTDLPNVPDSSNFRDRLESALNWSDLEWVRSITNMPLVIKGIQTAEDARLCIEHGVDAILVSNHGGHTLLGTTGSVNLLPEVMDVVGDRMDVYLDGGIRHGTDVLKALALGAKAVFVGRAMFWGLAVDGENGVRRVLEILRDELDVAMGLCGVKDVNNVDRNLVEATNGYVRKSDLVGQLERLAKLVDQGYLTREEFETQKGKLLAP